MPSYVSMQASLYKLTATISDEEVGEFWFSRLVEWMHMFEGARERLDEERFIDIDYREVARDPVTQARKVLRRMGITMDGRLNEALDDS